MERGWLIENGKQGNELRYRTMRQGIPVWTPDHMEAMRFCRRVDAERFAAEDDDAWRIAEHAWDTAECQHTNRKCVYESDDGEVERWQCQDCGERFGVEIPQ